MAVFFILALVGFVVSVVAHSVGYWGSEAAVQGVEPYFFMIHVGAIFLGFVAVMTVNRTQRSMDRRQSDAMKEGMKYCPGWMKKWVGIFFAYAIVNFILFALTEGSQRGDGQGITACELRGFSGHWMVFYFVEMLMFYSTMKRRRLDRGFN